MIATHSRLRAKVSSVVIAWQGSKAWATHVGDLISTQISLQVNALEIALAVEACGGGPAPASVDTVARPGAQTARARFDTGDFADRVLDADCRGLGRRGSPADQELISRRDACAWCGAAVKA